MKNVVLWAALSATMVAGCSQTSRPAPEHPMSELTATAPVPQPTVVPESVADDVMAMPLVAAPTVTLPRFNVAASQVPAADFFASLVADSNDSIVVHPDVSGVISLQLKQVTLPEVMQIVQSMYGYEIRQQGAIYQVFPAGMRTETIPLNYLMLQRSGMSSVSVNSGGVSQENNNSGGNGMNNGNSLNQQNGMAGMNVMNGMLGGGQYGASQFNGTVIQSSSKTDFWKDLEKSLQSLIGMEEGRNVIVSPQAGLITVRGMPDDIAAVRRFLQQAEQHLQRQVVLEAKIIEVTLNDDYQQGINWQNALASSRSTNFNFQLSGGSFGNQTSNSIGGLTSLSFSNADFGGVIKLLQTQGDAQVLSSPRITAVNNQQAVIKVGQDEYFVTNVSSTTTTTGTGVQNSTPNVTLQPFFSGIALDVTPQIDENGQVILHIHPSVTETSEQTKTIKLTDDDLVLPLAQSNIRESDTVIKANNGEIVVIGGLMQTVVSESESGVPGLRSLPVVGNLFKSKTKTSRKKELVILLKPILTDATTWQQQVQQSQQRMQGWSQP